MSNSAPPVRRDSRLSVRASESDKALLARAAQARQMNVSQFVLEVSLDAAHVILADQNEFRLPPEQWDAFCRRLDAPPQAIPALQQLFREAGPFHG